MTCRNEYFTVDIMDNAIAPLVSFESQPPIMRLLSSGELLLKQDRKAMLTDGMSSKDSTISVQVSPLSWTTSPQDLVVHFPYLLSIQPEQLEVHSTFSWRMFQRMPLVAGSTAPTLSNSSGGVSSSVSASSLTSLHGIQSFVTRNTALVGYDEAFVLVHSERSVYALVAPPYPAQSEALVASGNIEEGIFLLEETCAESRDYQTLMSQLQLKAAWARFKTCDWKRSIVHFSNARAPPSLLIPSFPSLLLLESQKNTDEERIVTNVIKKNLQNSGRSSSKISSTDHDTEIEKALREACVYLTEYLETLRAKQLASITTSNNSAKSNSTAPAPLYDEATLLQMLSAIFISKVRYGSPALGANASHTRAVRHFLSSLTESEQSLCFPVFEHWCTINKFHVSLGLIYSARKLNRKALDEWTMVAAKEKVGQESPSNALEETFALLQSIEDIELIEQFAPRAYASSGNNAAHLLNVLASTTRPSGMLPLSWVQSFLEKYDKTLIEQYLERLVFELSTNDEKTETALAWLYLSLIPPEQLNSPQNNTNKPLQAASSSSSASTIGPERQKLLTLLEQKNSYNAASVLARIESLPLPYAKIALYEKLGNHEKALSVIVNELGDFDRAESYCLKHEREGSDDLLSSLLRVYLALDADFDHQMDGGGGDDGQKLPRRAMDLIERHPTRLRPSTVLMALPSDTPISAVESFLVQSMRAHLATMRLQMVANGLERSHNMAVTAERTALHQRSFLITHDTTCPVCNRPIQPGLFARYPNNVLVHVPCVKNKNIDPVTGRNFYRSPQE